MEATVTSKRYQCRDCIYAYNPLKGDPKQGIAPGTLFEDLPAEWKCPVCGVKKHRFKPLPR